MPFYGNRNEWDIQESKYNLGSYWVFVVPVSNYICRWKKNTVLSGEAEIQLGHYINSNK